MKERIQELEEKVQWFRENQKLLHEEEESTQDALQALRTLKERTKKAEDEARRAKDLEKKCKLLEETIKSKNPNSIPMLIQATKEQSADPAQIQSLKNNVKQLQYELDSRDKDFEKRIRTLRQEQERMKQQYEKRQG